MDFTWSMNLRYWHVWVVWYRIVYCCWLVIVRGRAVPCTDEKNINSGPSTQSWRRWLVVGVEETQEHWLLLWSLALGQQQRNLALTAVATYCSSSWLRNIRTASWLHWSAPYKFCAGRKSWRIIVRWSRATTWLEVALHAMVLYYREYRLIQIYESHRTMI